jgi:hypothetical protein
MTDINPTAIAEERYLLDPMECERMDKSGIWSKYETELSTLRARLRSITEAAQVAADALDLSAKKANPLQKQGEDYIWRPATAIYMHSTAALSLLSKEGITPSGG